MVVLSSGVSWFCVITLQQHSRPLLCQAEFDTLLKKIKKEGYTVAYKTLSTHQHGVPQHRPRVYTVCILDPTRSFDFPEPLGHCLDVETSAAWICAHRCPAVRIQSCAFEYALLASCVSVSAYLGVGGRSAFRDVFCASKLCIRCVSRASLGSLLCFEVCDSIRSVLDLRVAEPPRWRPSWTQMRKTSSPTRAAPWSPRGTSSQLVRHPRSKAWTGPGTRSL